MGGWAHLTNDLLYESKDSREIENGSISDSPFIELCAVPEVLDRRGQKLFFSTGDGCETVSKNSSIFKSRPTGK